MEKLLELHRLLKSKVGYHFPGKLMCGSNYDKEALVETISIESE